MPIGVASAQLRKVQGCVWASYVGKRIAESVSSLFPAVPKSKTPSRYGKAF